MKDSKFIIVKDEATVNAMITAGFQVVSHMNGVCTFMNVIPQCFTFANIDVKKLAYTNTLVF